MKKGFLIISLFFNYAYGQLIVNIIPPSQGLVQKDALWNFTITNTSILSQQVQVELLVSDIKSSQPVISGISKFFIVPTGTMRVNNMNLNPVTYSLLNPEYNIDLSPNGLLPFGNFELCYSFFVLAGDRVSRVSQQCIPINILPFSPPILLQPENNASLDIKTPTFTWLPPEPLLNNRISYDLHVCEINGDQSPEEAIQNNNDYFLIKGLNQLMITYPSTSRSLEINKSYVWQIIAKEAGSEIGKSDIWKFYISPPKQDIKKEYLAPYIKVNKTLDDNSITFYDKIQIEYLNESTDDKWKILIHDVSSGNNEIFILEPDIKLMRGRNLLGYNAANDPRFISNHIYLLQIVNSRNELWQIQFLYKHSGK